MGIFSRILTRVFRNSSLSALRAAADGGIEQQVTPDTGMRISVVFSCVRLVAGAVAQLPCKVYRHTDSGREAVRPHPRFYLVGRRPNPWQDAFLFWEYAIHSLMLNGNFYAIKNMAGDKILSLDTVPASRVSVEILPIGEKKFKVRGKDGTEKAYSQNEMFHVCGQSTDGVSGVSPIEFNRTTVGLALNLSEHGNNYFRNGAFPGLVFSHPGKLSDQAQKRIKDQIIEKYSGKNAHRPMVIEEGMAVSPLAINNTDAQYIDARRMTREEICGLYGVPPHMIGATQQARGWSTTEAQMQEFVNLTLSPWIARIESAVNNQLIPEREREDVYARFVVSALLRGDTKTRADYYMRGINWGWLCPNDVRRLEDMNDRPGGDEYLRPLNMQIGGNGNGQAQDS